MVEAEEVETLAAFGQLNDPGLRRLRLQAEVGQQGGDPRERGLGLLPGFTHHYEIVDVADQRPVPAVVPCPVEPVQVDVSHQR